MHQLISVLRSSHEANDRIPLPGVEIREVRASHCPTPGATPSLVLPAPVPRRVMSHQKPKKEDGELCVSDQGLQSQVRGRDVPHRSDLQ